MKLLNTLIFSVFFSTLCLAQNGINYKAIIKDNNGNVIANDLISVQFTILQGTAQTNVYRENHTPTTDANGLIILNIGEGTPVSGTFNTIDWATNTTFLNTKINTGAGLVDMGTTEFKTVPYAISAKTATVAANVTGLEAIDEGNGIGWRLKGLDPNNFGNIGKNAVDLSKSLIASSSSGATGNYSTAMGGNSTASGLSSIAMGTNSVASGGASTAMGQYTTASGGVSTTMGLETEAIGYASLAAGRSTIAAGDYATAMGETTIASGDFSLTTGRFTTASGEHSTAMGNNTTALGNSSTAMGVNTISSGTISTAMGNATEASSYASVAIGQYNVGGGNAVSWEGTDPLFEIGNGYNSTNRTNALTVLKNGTITAPSFDLYEIIDPKALITKEYADTNLGSSGLEKITEGGNTGWRLKDQNSSNHSNIGNKAVDLSYGYYYSTTAGASGPSSTAMGVGTTASGDSSTAMGTNTTASGDSSTAMGTNTTASGNRSIAIGFDTTASGRNSIAMGVSTTASSYASLAIGQYNVGGGNATSWIATDPLFEVGFGTNSANKSNALTVTKNGRVGIGTNTPTTFLQLTNGYEATLSNNTGYFLIGRETGPNLLFDTNEILARNNGGIANLHLQQEGGNVYVGGTLTHSSDRRLKKDIAPLSYGLETILQLNPVAYNWINRTQDRKSLGLIAQEVQPIVAEIVHEDDDEAKTLSVSYTELIPVLIKAIQEQQEIILNQKKELKDQKELNNTQNSELAELKQNFRSLISKIEVLELKASN